jgi:4'-phosphopantetheinyl transferase
MIDWLTQRWVDCAPPGPSWLTEAERGQCEALKAAKRRQDWLLGRWTAKRLLQAALDQGRGRPLPLNVLEVQAASDGAPQAAYHQHGRRMAGPTISLSHAGDRALCALCLGASRLGADLERVEPRDPRFVEDYFAPAEIDLVEQAPSATRDLHVTAIWSAKEAVLKALRVGLRVDTRAVICRVLPVAASPDTWASFTIALDPARWPGRAPVLAGWWRSLEGYTLALVTGDRPGAGTESRNV